MKYKISSFPFFVLLLLEMTSCLKPRKSDFGKTVIGMEKEEILWVLQIPKYFERTEEAIFTEEDSLQLLRYNQKFFDEELPQLLREAFQGQIELYEEKYLGKLSEMPIEISQRLIELGINSPNYSAFSRKILLVSRYHTQKGLEPLYLIILWVDPSKKQPDQRIAALSINHKMQNLASKNWEQFYAIPSYFLTNEREYIPKNREEAIFLRDQVLSGKWKEIQWLDKYPNRSVYMPQKINPEKLLDYVGEYDVVTEDAEKRRLFLFAEENHLVAEWVDEYNTYPVYAMGKDSFFSPGGELFFWFGDTHTDSLCYINRSDTFLLKHQRKNSPD